MVVNIVQTMWCRLLALVWYYDCTQSFVFVIISVVTRGLVSANAVRYICCVPLCAIAKLWLSYAFQFDLFIIYLWLGIWRHAVAGYGLSPTRDGATE